MNRRSFIVCMVGTFKAGDPPPTGYLDWHEWAHVQYKAGLRQTRRACGHWYFAHERACAQARGSGARA